MHTQVVVRDEVVFRVGPPPVEFILALPAEQIAVRELIRARVEQEVAAFNAQHAALGHGLVQPTAAELTLNGTHVPRQQHVDAAEHTQRALHAFACNGFMILVDGQQVEHLDDQVMLTPTTVVTFLKLVPLVGG